MKNLLLKVSLAFALMLGVVNAQAAEKEFGVKAGISVASVTGLEYESNSNVSYTFGLVANFLPINRFSIGAELNYQVQGVSYEYYDYGYRYDFDYNYNYLNVPVMAGLNIFGGLWLKAGIQFGFLMGVSCVEYEDNYEVYRESYSPADLDMNTLDISIPLAISYDLVAGLSIEARYAIGTTDLYKYEQEGKYRNDVFTLTAGFRF